MKWNRSTKRSPEAALYQAWYRTPLWRQLRASQIKRQPWCERHLREKRGLVKATIAHHKRAHRGNWELFIDPTNLESVCDDCHGGAIQREEARGLDYSTAIDPATGWPIDPKHPANA